MDMHAIGHGGRRLAAGALLAAALGGTGCVQVIPYQPDEGVVTRLGPEDSRVKLKEALNRSVEPRVTSVDVNDERVEYGWQQTYIGAFYQAVTTSNVTQIFFANIARIEIYENHSVFIWGPGDARVDKVRFANAEDAKTFADLIMSFRARRLAK